MNKVNKELLFNRAIQAASSMYHNATPVYISPQNDKEAHMINEFIADQGEGEIDHIHGGGAHGGDSTTDFVANQYKTKEAQRIARRCYVVRRDIEVSKYALYERIINYGTLYTYGRGGRTLAPSDLVDTRQGHMQRPNMDFLESLTRGGLTELILVVESFNKYVKDWNNSLDTLWNEYKLENDLQQDINDNDSKRQVTRTVTTWE